MNAKKSLPSPALETFADELDSHIAESLQDLEFRAANVDVERRLNLIRALVELRHQLGLTQSQLARRMGVGQSTVSGFETEGSDPRLSTLQRYARAVQADCEVAIHPVARCDWIAPRHVYLEHAESPKVHVDSSAPSAKTVAWARRRNFALAS